MYLEQKFGFGKYKGLTLREVYQGTNRLDDALIQAFLKHKLFVDAEIIALNEPFIRTDKIEINNPFITIELYNEDLKGDWSKSIQNIFSEGNKLFDFLQGNTTLRKFYTEHYSKINSKLILGGNPQYIEWCIKNIEHFYVDIEQLDEFLSLDIYHFVGISVEYKGENVYEYSPAFSIKKHVLSQETKDINLKKNIKIIEKKEIGEIVDYEDQKRDYYRNIYK